MRRVILLGAGGRDFHDFAVVFRDDPEMRVVAFTAAQIPGIDDRRYPPSLAGPAYPEGIPIRPQAELTELIRAHDVDEAVLAYSDLSYPEVMRLAAEVMAAGADFRLLGPDSTMLVSTKPVVAVCASRTGAGKSQTTRRIGRILADAGLRVALVRHPMPSGDLEEMRVQRFATLDDIEAAHPTIEEREEYELPVREGMVMFAGVDYEAILRAAEAEADVIVWDGGNNDLPFFRPDLWVTVVDPLRPGHECGWYPGEVNVRLADVVVVNKVDSAAPADVGTVLGNVRRLAPTAIVVQATSPVVLSDGPSLADQRVLVVEDGPTVTHGGMPFGAGTVAARTSGAGEIVDPRPYAVGSIAATFEQYPHIGAVLPAMGYGDEQLAELAATIAAVPCDVVVTGTPVDLTRFMRIDRPVRHASYELHEITEPGLAELLEPFIESWRPS